MRLLPTLAGFLLITTAALAQPAQDAPGQPPQESGQLAAPHMTMRQRFEAANTTRDGRLTRDQAQQAGMRMIAAHFDAIDADRKGYITLQDLHAFQQARQQARAGQHQPSSH